MRFLKKGMKLKILFSVAVRIILQIWGTITPISVLKHVRHEGGNIVFYMRAGGVKVSLFAQ
jgi:hypothetical protein